MQHGAATDGRVKPGHDDWERPVRCGRESDRSASWFKVIAFRNRLIHGYWSVDHILVWDVIVNDLPLLKHEVGRLLGNPVP